MLSVSWEQLGRISVSVAAYKSLMEACALERRSYELSSGSLILTHSTLYCMPHTGADTHSTRYGEKTLGKEERRKGSV